MCTKEFKAETVRPCGVGDRSVALVAHDLDLTETPMREYGSPRMIAELKARGVAGKGRGGPTRPVKVRSRSS